MIALAVVCGFDALVIHRMVNRGYEDRVGCGRYRSSNVVKAVIEKPLLENSSARSVSASVAGGHAKIISNNE